MRPRKARAKDYPGRIAYHGRGICANCYMEGYRERQRQAEAAELRTANPLDSQILRRMEEVSPGTAKLIHSRRVHEVPAQGGTRRNGSRPLLGGVQRV